MIGRRARVAEQEQNAATVETVKLTGASADSMTLELRAEIVRKAATNHWSEDKKRGYKASYISIGNFASCGSLSLTQLSRIMDDSHEAEQDAAMSFLDPLLGQFYAGWHAAYSTYRAYLPEHTADHDDSTAASCVRCHMWAFVQNQVAGQAGVTLLERKGLKLLNYCDRFVLRFKQVNSAGLHQNYQTEQQNDFDQDEDIPGIPQEAIRVTSGYQPTTGGDAIERVVVARVYGRTVLWLAQVNVIATEAVWEDITPARLVGTTRTQANFRRRGGA